MADRLYRVVRQAAKDSGKQVRLDIVGGSIEVDRGVLDRMTGPFEHLLRNGVAHGIESPEARTAAGKDASGTITISLAQEGNEVAVEFRDDGAGLNLARIRERALALGLLAPDAQASDAELANLIFAPGFSTAESVSELSGRGVGMDVVRAEVNAMGGRIETATAAGQGAIFRLVLPLTTAVTQVVMLRCGELSIAVPSTLIELVKRVPGEDVEQAYAAGAYTLGDKALPFFWLGALLQAGGRGSSAGRSQPVVVIRSAAQRVALHVDEVLGNQEVVVKNLGPQLARLPGLAGITLLPSGAVALIYNPVALATLYGDAAREQGRHVPGVGEPIAAPVGRDACTAGAGGGRFAHRAACHAAPAHARGLSGHAGQGWAGCAGQAQRGAAHGGVVGHRDAAHGRLRPGAQHALRRAPGGVAGDHDHLAHRAEAPRLCGAAGREPLSRQALFRRAAAVAGGALRAGSGRPLNADGEGLPLIRAARVLVAREIRGGKAGVAAAACGE